MKTEFSFHETAFFGRPYKELLRCFGLASEQLRGCRVLDCPGGPDSFAAQGSREGIIVTAVDPLYYLSAAAIAQKARSEFVEMYRKVRSATDLIRWKTYKSIDESEAVRLSGLEVFLQDYRIAYPTGRYVPAMLPDLPFEDGAFDISICGHLLFIYGHLFSEDFHRLSIRELARVSRKEIRIHPLVGLDGERHPLVDSVHDELGQIGWESEEIEVEHEFFRGTNTTLIGRAK